MRTADEAKQAIKGGKAAHSYAALRRYAVPAMIEYYRQATLDEKLNTTDLTLTKQPTKPKKL